MTRFEFIVGWDLDDESRVCDHCGSVIAGDATNARAFQVIIAALADVGLHGWLRTVSASDAQALIDFDKQRASCKYGADHP